MVPYISYTDRGGAAIGLKLEEAVTSGVLFGVAGLLVRKVMLMVRADLGFMLNFFSDPLAWFAVVVGLIGFAYMQVALYKEKISYVVPTVSAFSIITPLIISVVFLNETVQAVRWLGTFLVIVGVVGISRTDVKDGVLNGMLKWINKAR